MANNSAGSYSDQINITVNDHAPVPINAFSDNITLDYGQAITPIGEFEVRPDSIAAVTTTPAPSNLTAPCGVGAMARWKIGLRKRLRPEHTDGHSLSVGVRPSTSQQEASHVCRPR